MDISANSLLNFYFLNVDISLIIKATNLILSIHVENITVEGTVSQNFDIGLGSICRKYRTKYSEKLYNSYPFFGIKSKLRPKSKI